VIDRMWRSQQWRWAAAGLAVAVTACSTASSGVQPGERSTTAPASPPPARPAPLAEGRLAGPKLIVRLTKVTRSAPDVLTLSFAVSNADPAVTVSLGAIFAAAETDIDSMAGAYLLDEAHQKKYFVLRGDHGRPACREGVGPIPAGQERVVWCRFPGPSRGVSRITVSVPHLPMFRNMPISGPAGDRDRR
jgi:hypothetical protein